MKRRLPVRALLRCACPLLWLLLAGAQPLGAVDATAGLVSTLRSLRPETGQAETDRLARELARQPGSIEAWLEVSALHALPPELDELPAPLNPAQTRLIGQLAARLAPAEVVRHLGAALASPREEAWRRAGLELLSLHAMASELPLMRALVGGESGESAQGQELLGAYQAAVTLVLRRDSTAFATLGATGPVEALLAEAMVRAVGRCDDPEGFSWLARELRDPRVCDAALQEIGRLAARARPLDAEEIGLAVKPFLDSDVLARRRQAMRTLAALGTASVAPRLVAALDSAERGERRAACDALRELSGRDLPEDGAAWRAWLADEVRWWREESEHTRAALGSEDDAEVVSAIRSLSTRSLRRDVLARELGELLRSHGSRTIRAQACLGLAQLGSRAACDDLLAVLEDPDSGLRGRACAALTAITGLSLPAERAPWETALRPTRRL